MTATSRIHLRAALVAAIVTGLAVVDWAMTPAKAAFWMVAIGTAFGIWLVVTLMGRARSFEEYSTSERAFLSTSIIAAGALLAAGLLRHLANAMGFADGDLLDRGLGVGSGMILLLLGNTMPKVLAPLTAKRCAPAQVQSIQRFSGWAFVLDGLVCIVASLALPVSRGQDVAMIATMLALLVIAIRYAWAFLAPARTSQTST
jgi:hypothetical protein